MVSPGVVAAPMAGELGLSAENADGAPATSISGLRTWVWGIE